MNGWSVHLTEADARGSMGKQPGAGARVFAIEESLGYLVNRAARAMAHQLAGQLRSADVGIGQWAILMFLWARDGMTQADLSRLVAIEPPTMVRTIDRMVRDGFVRRTPDPGDGRLSRIHLTDRGRSLRDELVPRAIAVNEAVGRSMTVSEAETLRRLLRKLISGAAPAGA
jgi:DNA-binding MarR family transcriptional regulator